MNYLKSLLAKVLRFFGYRGEIFGADVKISDFTTVTTTGEDTIIPIVDNPGVAGGNKKITVKNLLIAFGLVTGATLAALVVTNLTVTNLTVNTAATLPSGTTVATKQVCLADGTNCIASGGGGSQTLAQVTSLGSSATATVQLYGGATIGGTLTATGTVVLPSGTTVNSQNVCLADGTNCIATGGLDPRFVYNATLDAMRPATNSTDFWVGGTASTTYITNSSVSSTNATHISVTSSEMWMNIPAGPGRPFRIQEGGVDAIRMGTLTGSTNGLIWCGNNVECYLRYGGNNSGEGINIQGDPGDDNTGLIENAAFAWGSALQPITSIGTTTGTTFGTTFGKSAQKFLVVDGHVYPNQHLLKDLGSTNTRWFGLYNSFSSTTNVSSTNISIISNLTVNNQAVCLADGTNCPASAGGASQFTFYPTGTFGPYLATTTGVAVSSTNAFLENASTTFLNATNFTATAATATNIDIGPGSVALPSLAFTNDVDTGIYGLGGVIAFSTDGTQRGTISSSAFTSVVTIAESNTTPQIHLVDTTGGEDDFYLNANADVFKIENLTTSDDYLTIDANGNIVMFPNGATSSRAFAAPYIIATSTFRMLGTSTSTFAGPASSTLLVVSSIEENTAALAYVCADAQGKIYKDSTLACVTSNPNQKDNIQPLKMGLSTIMALEPIEFDWKPGQARTGHSMGFNAVQAAEVDERLIARDENGEVKGFRYMEFTAALTKGIQELAYKNDEQDDRLNALEAENLKLHEEIIKLNQRLESLIK